MPDKNGYGGGSGGAQMVKVKNDSVEPPSGNKGKVDLWIDWKKNNVVRRQRNAASEF